MTQEQDIEVVKSELRKPVPKISTNLLYVLTRRKCLDEVTKQLDDRLREAQNASPGMQLASSAGAGGPKGAGDLLAKARAMMEEDLKIHPT